jgi:hypothetical protein
MNESKIYRTVAPCISDGKIMSFGFLIAIPSGLMGFIMFIWNFVEIYRVYFCNLPPELSGNLFLNFLVIFYYPFIGLVIFSIITAIIFYVNSIYRKRIYLEFTDKSIIIHFKFKYMGEGTHIMHYEDIRELSITRGYLEKKIFDAGTVYVHSITPNCSLTIRGVKEFQEIYDFLTLKHKECSEKRISNKNIDNNNISLEKSLEKIEIAKKLHKQKIDLNTISAATNLTLDQLKTILDL